MTDHPDIQHKRAALRTRIEKLFGLDYLTVAHRLMPTVLAEGPDLEDMLGCSDLDLLEVVDLTVGDKLQALRRGAPIPARLVPLGGWFSVPKQDGGRYVFQRVSAPPDAEARGTAAQAVDILIEPNNPPSIWVYRCFEGRVTSRPYPLAEAALVFYPLSG